MNFLRNYKGQIIFLFLGILSGFFIAKINCLHFEDTINPMDFANLILTVILAILIALYIEPTSENKRVEKDILMDQLKIVKSAGKDIHDIFISTYSENPLSEESKNKIKNHFRNASNQLNLFLDQARHCKKSIISSQEKEIKEKLFKLKQSITGGLFEKENFTFSSGNYNKYETAFMVFSKAINHIIIDINKS